MASPHAHRPSATGTLKERPLPRLLQQLFRKQVTGCLGITDQTGDLSEIYLRSGYPVHVHRPVDSDRLDRVLIESGLVSERAVEMAMPMVANGMRLGEALERMGALTKQTLADVLKAQMRRKITRLFCINEGSFEIFIENHGYGQGDEWMAMRVDPRSLYYLAIRTAYDLPRMTRELSRLWGQQFRLVSSLPAYLAGMQIPADDPVVAALRAGWQTLEKVDPVAPRPVEARAVLLALYYGDMLERENLMEGGADKPVAVPPSTDNLIPGNSASGELPEAVAEPVMPEVTAEPVLTPPPVESPVVLVPATPIVTPVSIPPSTPMPAAILAPDAPLTPPPPIVTPLSISPAGPTAHPAALVPAPPARRPLGSPSPDAPVIAPASPRFSPAPEAPALPPARPRLSPSPETHAKAQVHSSPSPEGPKARPTGPAMPAVPAVDQALRTALTTLAQKLDHLSYFELLEVPESAPASDISNAFFRAARRYHPDRLAGAGLADMAPQAERVLARMSEAAMTLGDPAKRAAYLAERSGTKKAPESFVPSVVEAETAFLKGEVFLKKGDYSKAIECFTAACRANPNEPQFRAYLAWARFDNPKGRKEAVVREVQRIITDVVSVQPKFTRGHYWLGLIWKFLNEPDRAERCFREAVSQDQEFIDATRELRLCEMRRQRGGGPHKGPEAPRGGLMGRLFKR